ncbi:Serine/threonine-protein kinase [Lachnellula hyalina]|uniref:Autophagy-related protein 1 n=1 Tax=Lachnellula hyalina TaxID=1316788 RepID=A0A8H8QUG6_9HELO|nr:Serine/threonine-protein kinase [Lachnellula hyalina]TVY22726.1 Serine/threonine-protein kinase [Lachnellula hyalina]
MADTDSNYVATQQYNDERRYGQGNSGLSDEDASDIICVLYPMTINANRAADQIYKATPQNTLETRSDIHIKEKVTSAEPAVNTFEIAAEGLVPCGIALRLSANLKDPLMGFQFGRNADRCDFPVGNNDPGRRVSNTHFRIYINEHCVIMIEDQSTNGTMIDRTLLKAKEKENNMAFKHTLDSGQKIVITGGTAKDDLAFMTWIPNRSDEAELAYQQNVTKFFLRKAALRDQPRTKALMRPGRNGNPVNLFPTPAANTPDYSPISTFGKHIREWKGGSKYNRVAQIGKGAFAIVYKVTAKLDGTPFAAKELEKRRFMKNGILDQKMDMEMRIMSKIQHENIVKYIEHIDWEDYLYIIMEYIPGGDLGTLITQNGPLPEPDVKDMARQLLGALGYLHGEGVTHRDVKPDNILIARRRPLHTKLTDFGLSKVVENEQTGLRTFCGTLLYCAPEVYTEYREYDQNGKRTVLRGKDKHTQPAARYDHAVDIWSLAGVLFFALCGSPPYPASNGSTYMIILNRIMTEPLDIRPLQLANVSENGIRFVRQMLHVRPEFRATIEELQQSSWLLGDDDKELSQDTELEQGTSQLSLQETDIEQGASQLSLIDDCEVEDSADFGQSVSDVTEIQQREIPGSFSDGISNVTSSYDYDYSYANGNGHPIINGNGNGRLFGEVNISDVGSSGAIPLDPQLNLPLPSTASNNDHHGIHPKSDLNFDDSERHGNYSEDQLDPSQSDHLSQLAGVIPSTEPAIAMAPPTHIPATTNFKAGDLRRQLQGQGLPERAVRSSSLMGTESMVGQLNMHSPVSAASPGATSPPDAGREMNTSLRRPREEGLEDDENWQPADLPAKRRRKSQREIDMPVPQSIFWDPADKSTHHHNYPTMLTSDYNNLKDWAKSKGEEFEQGHKSFEGTMKSFFRSRSHSNSFVEVSPVAGEQAVDEGRHMLMKRDDRTLDDINPQTTPSRDVEEDYIPSTARVSYAGSPRPDVPSITMTDAPLVPAFESAFHVPKRVLAKLITTPDSCISNINLSITENVTSWGRAPESIVRYPNTKEGRVPKSAFKIILFEAGPNVNSEPKPAHAASKEENKAFYISTKASQGIWINDVQLFSYKPEDRGGYSRYWGELRDGDLVTAWKDEQQLNLFTRFRFECYMGRSKIPRKGDEKFQLNKNLSFLAEIEDACIKQHELILKEQAKARAEQAALVEGLNKENDTENSTREGKAKEKEKDVQQPLTF